MVQQTDEAVSGAKISDAAGLLSRRRGAMELEGEPSAEIAIRPFVGPRTCTVHITQGRNSSE